MAKIRLRQSETTNECLPKVCMACGQPAVTHLKKTFRWYPEWIGVFILLGVVPFWIAAAVMSKYMTVDVPVCPQHRRYFANRVTALVIVVALIFVVPALITLLVMQTTNPWQRGNELMSGCFAFILCIIVGIVVIYVIQNSMIRPKEITDRSITLVRVDDGFVSAMEDLRYAGEIDDDYDDRPRRRRYRDDDERPRPPRGADSFRDRPDADDRD